MTTPNPFTPQDAQRLREARDKSASQTGIYHTAEYATIAANAVPAMLDLIDVLAEVAVAAVAYGSVNTDCTQEQAERLVEAVRAFEASQHAEWLKRGR